MQHFLNKNCEIVDFEEKADIYIINTCTVTNIADRKSRQMLRRVKQLAPESTLVACGCYAQVAKEELEKIPEIDLILGTNEKNRIIEEVEAFEKERKSLISDVMHQVEFLEFGPTTYTEKTRAVIKVQDGCDRFCSYCIIPYARGRVRSRKKEDVLLEINKIAKLGIKEVVITGIHLASYGKDFENPNALIELLNDINKIEGIERIRLGSLEPTLMTEEFITPLSKLEKICDHFHLSLQSGCDETLKRMNRRYTIEEFKEVVERLRNTYNDVILTTDIIVGFPGETQEEFDKTYEFLKQIKFYKTHVFPYSVRKGTKAAEMSNQVEAQEKERRSKILIELSNENQLDYNKKYIGKVVDVLIEEDSKGHTANYILVKAQNDKELENKIVKVKIAEAKEEHIEGNIV